MERIAYLCDMEINVKKQTKIMDWTYHIFSPYRVCPLGAHIDHQRGIVTGFAINKGVDLWFNVREDSEVHLTSLSFEGEVKIDLSARSEVKERHWGDYARGAKYALKKRFDLQRGIEGVIQGSLPVGGLSSSAAVLIAYVMAFAKANGISLQPFEIVQIASEAEREYIGLNNGLLDQACIALGRKDGLLFLDCDSNEWRIIRRNPKMPEFEIGIFFSGLTRTLVNSDYNLRVYECKTAAWNMLAYQNQPLKTFDKTFLRDIPKEAFDKTRDMMPLRFARRAEHRVQDVPPFVGKHPHGTLRHALVASYHAYLHTVDSGLLHGLEVLYHTLLRHVAAHPAPVHGQRLAVGHLAEPAFHCAQIICMHYLGKGTHCGNGGPFCKTLSHFFDMMLQLKIRSEHPCFHV